MCKCQCGNKILVRTSYLTSGHTQSCGCLLSKGENKIAFLLRENNIPFIQQKTFDTCRFNDTNYLAKFDFYVNNQYLIEYDGIQHFQNLYFSHAEKNKEHDEFKNQWCKENNIPLIRISYIHYDNLSIEDLLLNTTSFLI
ncbi:MAG: hypothetical protein LIO71_02785 [Ruminococcus sp.]|nr:hypothetical protein [Ruminococcus sp.]